jgi:GNAT superfamily N-acetyltransferase
MSDESRAVSSHATVRKAETHERAAVVSSVIEAFANDPAWAFILDGEYERLAPHFAGALFDIRLAAGTVWVTDDLAATAMWDRPKSVAAAAPTALAGRTWASYRALAGPDAAARLTRYNGAVASKAPEEPYWYLGVLATRPSAQGQGLASAVLAPIIREADRDGLACCLETSTVGNRRFYEHRGFTQATDITLPDGPPTWWLRRSPPPRS